MSLANELKKIPPLTRISLASAVLIAGPIFLKLMSPRPYAFYWPMITSKLQVLLQFSSAFLYKLTLPLRYIVSTHPSGYHGVRATSTSGYIPLTRELGLDDPIKWLFDMVML